MRASPRAADLAVGGLARLCLKTFLVAQFFSLTRLFFSNHVGEGLSFYASQAGLLSVGLLVPALVGYGLASGSLLGRLTPVARLWICAVLALAVPLFFYGWLDRGYMVTAAAHDLLPYLVVVAFVILGSLPVVWQDLDRLVLLLFAGALVVNGLGMTEITRVVSEATADDRAGVSIVAYRTQGALAFWPLLFLTARLRRPPTMALIFAGVFFVLGQQILFQKRSPTFRVALFILVFFAMLPRPFPGVGAATEARARLLFAGIGTAALIMAVVVAPWLFEGQLLGLARRLSGQAYSGGAAGMLTTENERFFEAGLFLRTLEPEELVMGRGFGGYFRPDASWWGTWLDDVGEFGRRQLHVGGLMPLFKGGLALAVTYYSGLVAALLRGLRARADPLAAAVFFVLLLHALFLLQEGWFVMSVAFDLVMVGLCMGRLLSDAWVAIPLPEAAFAEVRP